MPFGCNILAVSIELAIISWRSSIQKVPFVPQFDASNWGTKGTFWMDERQLIIANSMETANMLHPKGMTDKAVEALIQCIKLNPDNQEIRNKINELEK